ncbi:hypothetical protein BDR07DRAFT_1488614 [Suillus spraguei]|nr:hypothetical protein BDR07DRAFT_1488614 [Suillus spraguei]
MLANVFYRDELESMPLQVLQGLQDQDLHAMLKQGLSETSSNDPESNLKDVDIAMLFRPLLVLIKVIEYRQIFRDHNLPVWALQLCRRMVQRANIKPPLSIDAGDYQVNELTKLLGLGERVESMTKLHIGS